MGRITIIILAVLLSSSFADVKFTSLTKEEYKLYTLINRYRQLKGLPKVPVSNSLCTVAQLHCKDLAKNRPDTNKCNLHSWSDQGKWKPVCYYNDHRNAGIARGKPKELTTYKGDGYEIAAYMSGGRISAREALKLWKHSPGHNNIILGKGKYFKGVEWKAIGVGIYEGYACVWFGKLEE